VCALWCCTFGVVAHVFRQQMHQQETWTVLTHARVESNVLLLQASMPTAVSAAEWPLRFRWELMVRTSMIHRGGGVEGGGGVALYAQCLRSGGEEMAGAVLILHTAVGCAGA
jgi:hypothetical protein